MLKSRSRSLSLTVAAMALAASGTAMAGSSPNTAAQKADVPASTCCSATMEDDKERMMVASTDAFEYVGGEAGWQLRNPKYEFGGGGLVHAADCPLTVASSQVAPAGGGLLEPSPGA